MPVALEITLILILLALAGALVPLLIQLQRTAKGFDTFLVTMRKDVTQIAEDVHASRLRMDHLAVSVEVSLAELSSFSSSIGELGGTLREFHTRFRLSLESATRNLGGIIGGISAVLAFFKSKHAAHEPEQEHDHERT